MEKEILEAENKLTQSKNSLKRNFIKSKDKNEKINSTSCDSKKSKKKIVVGGNNEIEYLKKKIYQMQKLREQEKQLIFKEKAKNNELKDEIEKLQKKLKKIEIQSEKKMFIESDYKKLMESFEKSEFIREQQKKLITALKEELDLIRNKEKKIKKKKSTEKKKIN